MSLDQAAANLSTVAIISVQGEPERSPDNLHGSHLSAACSPWPDKRTSSLTKKYSDILIARSAVFSDTSVSDEANVLGTTSERFTKATPLECMVEKSLIVPLSKQQKRTSMVQFLAFCWCVFLTGWNDGTLGPLLPRIQTDYQVGFAIVSMIFIGNYVGYVTGATLNIWLNDRFGLGQTVTGGALCQLAGYVIMIPAPPFALMICAYVIIGFGISIQCAQANGFVCRLNRHMTLKLGVMHGAYGLGAFMSPFSSTHFSTLTSQRWAFHYIISAGLAVLNILISIYVFRSRRLEVLLKEAGQESDAEPIAQENSSTYKRIFKLKAMPLLLVFSLIYIGVEVTLGSWIVTFIIRERHGGSKAGFISSGFYGGFTTGRVCLIWLNQMVGERQITFVYIIIAIGLELTIWFVPSLIGNAVAVSLIGLVLGPIFPILVSHMTHILPQGLIIGCVGLVAGIGMAGSAALPFVTGLLASKYGIGSLQPLMISMMVCLLLIWALIPNSVRPVT